MEAMDFSNAGNERNMAMPEIKGLKQKNDITTAITNQCLLLNGGEYDPWRI